MTGEREDGKHRIVVGVDGSEGAQSALLWAAAEAMRRGEELEVVNAWITVGELGAARAVADKAAKTASLIYPNLAVTSATPQEPAVQALVEASAGEAMLVVGSRGLGGFRGLLLGSVSMQCVEHARGTVVVVRDHAGTASADEKMADAAPIDAKATDAARANQDVVVGVDGSPGSVLALRWAVEEAEHRTAPLLVVCAWQPTPLGGPVVLPADGWQGATDEILARAVEETHRLAPELTVETRGDFGAAVPTLLDAARGASLLVVGARGRGGFASMLLGSTGHAVVRHAPCPVAVVRPVDGRAGRPEVPVPVRADAADAVDAADG